MSEENKFIQQLVDERLRAAAAWLKTLKLPPQVAGIDITLHYDDGNRLEMKIGVGE